MDKIMLSQFRNDSLNQLRNLVPDKIIHFANSRIPANYTLVAQPDVNSLHKIMDLTNELKKLEPKQFYYPENILHLTLIGNLSLTTDIEKLKQNLPRIIKNYNFSFNLYGIGSNIHSSSVSAYPNNFSFHALREELRRLVGAHGDNFSSIIKSYEYVGWISYLRYLQKPSREFLAKLYSYKDTQFGQLKPQIIKLYKTTSKVLAEGDAELIYTLNL